jgi:AcrR family transcriptional regulator
MARLTRAESQARTREQLVETATALFLRDGYAVTSLEKVADEAGYSKGAVYSNFRSKQELCLAVLDGIHQEKVAEIVASLSGGGNLEERLAAFERWAERSIGDVAWTSLEVEFATTARHDDAVRAALCERDRQIRGRLALLIAAVVGPDLPLPAERIATALLSLGIGLGVQRVLDPAIDVTVLTDVIRLLAGPARTARGPESG